MPTRRKFRRNRRKSRRTKRGGETLDDVRKAFVTNRKIYNSMGCPGIPYQKNELSTRKELQIQRNMCLKTRNRAAKERPYDEYDGEAGSTNVGTGPADASDLGKSWYGYWIGLLEEKKEKFVQTTKTTLRTMVNRCNTFIDYINKNHPTYWTHMTWYDENIDKRIDDLNTKIDSSGFYDVKLIKRIKPLHTDTNDKLNDVNARVGTYFFQKYNGCNPDDICIAKITSQGLRPRAKYSKDFLSDMDSGFQGEFEFKIDDSMYRLTNTQIKQLPLNKEKMKDMGEVVNLIKSATVGGRKQRKSRKTKRGGKRRKSRRRRRRTRRRR